MKKTILFFLLLSVSGTLLACGQDKEKTSNSEVDSNLVGSASEEAEKAIEKEIKTAEEAEKDASINSTE